MKLKMMIGAAALALTAIACSPPAQQEAPAAPAPVAPISVDVPAGDYGLDLTHGSLTWKVNHMGLSNYTARFAKWDATITFDPANLSASKVVATIDPTSVKTDYPGDYKKSHAQTGFKSWDEDLAKSDKFFNAGKFPTITFTSTSVETTGEKTGKVTGDLTFLGVTKPVTLDVTFNGSKNPHPFVPAAAIGFSATGAIKRSDFGVAFPPGAVGDDVQIVIEGEFIQKVAAPAPTK